MCLNRISQTSLFDRFAEHEIGRELRGMSKLLDAHPQLLDVVANELGCSASTGRCGLTAESALRCALLKQYRQLSYEELAFHLQDSLSFQAFARLPRGWAPRRAALQANIAAISALTWEAINRHLLGAAAEAGVERGTMWRVDSTVVDSPVHVPSDSSLLLDGVRVMVRLLRAGQALAGAPVLDWHNHSRRAKRRARAIRHTRGQDTKRALYRDLLALTQATLGYLERAASILAGSEAEGLALMAWQGEVDRIVPLITQVIEQTRRRVFDGARVPAAQKVVSLFEAHTDLIVKDRREVHYDHKLNLASGRSGLIFDAIIDGGQTGRRRALYADAHAPHPGLWNRAAASTGEASPFESGSPPQRADIGHRGRLGQCIPPRAMIGHRHSTRPPRTPTYQS